MNLVDIDVKCFDARDLFYLMDAIKDGMVNSAERTEDYYFSFKEKTFLLPKGIPFDEFSTWLCIVDEDGKVKARLCYVVNKCGGQVHYRSDSTYYDKLQRVPWHVLDMWKKLQR